MEQDRIDAIVNIENLGSIDRGPFNRNQRVEPDDICVLKHLSENRDGVAYQVDTARDYPPTRTFCTSFIGAQEDVESIQYLATSAGLEEDIDPFDERTDTSSYFHHLEQVSYTSENIQQANSTRVENAQKGRNLLPTSSYDSLTNDDVKRRASATDISEEFPLDSPKVLYRRSPRRNRRQEPLCSFLEDRKSTTATILEVEDDAECEGETNMTLYAKDEKFTRAWTIATGVITGEHFKDLSDPYIPKELPPRPTTPPSFSTSMFDRPLPPTPEEYPSNLSLGSHSMQPRRNTVNIIPRLSPSFRHRKLSLPNLPTRPTQFFSPSPQQVSQPTDEIPGVGFLGMSKGSGLIMKMGYLMKQGGQIKSFRKRYFILRRDGSLCYYKNSEIAFRHQLASSMIWKMGDTGLAATRDRCFSTTSKQKPEKKEGVLGKIDLEDVRCVDLLTSTCIPHLDNAFACRALPIPGTSSLPTLSTDAHPFAFSVATPQRTYYFAAERQDEVNAWVNAIAHGLRELCSHGPKEVLPFEKLNIEVACVKCLEGWSTVLFFPEWVGKLLARGGKCNSEARVWIVLEMTRNHTKASAEDKRVKGILKLYGDRESDLPSLVLPITSECLLYAPKEFTFWVHTWSGFSFRFCVETSGWIWQLSQLMALVNDGTPAELEIVRNLELYASGESMAQTRDSAVWPRKESISKPMTSLLGVEKGMEDKAQADAASMFKAIQLYTATNIDHLCVAYHLCLASSIFTKVQRTQYLRAECALHILSQLSQYSSTDPSLIPCLHLLRLACGCFPLEGWGIRAYVSIKDEYCKQVIAELGGALESAISENPNIAWCVPTNGDKVFVPQMDEKEFDVLLPGSSSRRKCGPSKAEIVSVMSASYPQDVLSISVRIPTARSEQEVLTIQASVTETVGDVIPRIVKSLGFPLLITPQNCLSLFLCNDDSDGWLGCKSYDHLVCLPKTALMADIFANFEKNWIDKHGHTPNDPLSPTLFFGLRNLPLCPPDDISVVSERWYWRASLEERRMYSRMIIPLIPRAPQLKRISLLLTPLLAQVTQGDHFPLVHHDRNLATIAAQCGVDPTALSNEWVKLRGRGEADCLAIFLKEAREAMGEWWGCDVWEVQPLLPSHTRSLYFLLHPLQVGLFTAQGHSIVNVPYDKLLNYSCKGQTLTFTIDNRGADGGKIIKWVVLVRSGKKVEELVSTIHYYSTNKDDATCVMRRPISTMMMHLQATMKENNALEKLTGV